MRNAIVYATIDAKRPLPVRNDYCGETTMTLYSEPLAYFITFTTYGTWLHGDERGFVIEGTPGIQRSNPALLKESQEKMTQPPMTLSPEMRQCVERAIREYAAEKQWTVLALNVRYNHVHLVIRAVNFTPEQVMKGVKTRATTNLKVMQFADRERKIWSHHGSTKYVFDEDYLQNAVRYTEEQ